VSPRYRQRHLDERAPRAANVITLIGARSEPRGRLGNDGRERASDAEGVSEYGAVPAV